MACTCPSTYMHKPKLLMSILKILEVISFNDQLKRTRYHWQTLVLMYKRRKHRDLKKNPMVLFKNVFFCNGFIKHFFLQRDITCHFFIVSHMSFKRAGWSLPFLDKVILLKKKNFVSRFSNILILKLKKWTLI